MGRGAGGVGRGRRAGVQITKPAGMTAVRSTEAGKLWLFMYFDAEDENVEGRIRVIKSPTAGLDPEPSQ